MWPDKPLDECGAVPTGDMLTKGGPDEYRTGELLGACHTPR
jgi:hypothetical protein